MRCVPALTPVAKSFFTFNLKRALTMTQDEKTKTKTATLDLEKAEPLDLESHDLEK